MEQEKPTPTKTKKTKAEIARENGKKGGRPRGSRTKKGPAEKAAQSLKEAAAKTRARQRDEQKPGEKPDETSAPIILLLQACTAKEQAFILELVAHPDEPHRHAFRRAGFSAADDDVADSNAARVLSRDRVQRALEALRAEVLARRIESAVMDGEEAMERITRFGRADIGLVLGPEDPLSRLPESIRLCIKSVRETKYGRVIELHDALRANEDLAKAAGRLKETHEHKHTLRPLTDEEVRQLPDDALEQALAGARALRAVLGGGSAHA